VRLPILNRGLLRLGLAPTLTPAAPELLDLPERVVQFGTGAFLRGFVDAFLDDANRRGSFGGRVVAIGSTRSGREHALNAQDGLYTLILRGLEGGTTRRESRVITSISRALVAQDDWNEVLAVARLPALEFVFSNTTEVGLSFSMQEKLQDQPPQSYPAKLTRFLFERAQAFDYSAERGIVVLPCELIENNGDRLMAAVLALADRWDLPSRFARWVQRAVPFCNTLVDRIVAGTPDDEECRTLQGELGYSDALITIGEPYALFAIEADRTTKARLRFAANNPAIVVTDDIAAYRERKVRLLNGAHTLLAPLALLCGCRTVCDALAHEALGPYVRRLLLEELVPTVQRPAAREFALQVLERFGNPFIDHALIDLTLQSTTKLRVRVLPSLLMYTRVFGRAPSLMALGFAAFLLYQRGDLQETRRAAGLDSPRDDGADYFRRIWHTAGSGIEGALYVTREICSNRELWGTDLSELAGWVPLVAEQLSRMSEHGVQACLASSVERPVIATRA
jgi:tagaturonate reductase